MHILSSIPLFLFILGTHSLAYAETASDEGIPVAKSLTPHLPYQAEFKVDILSPSERDVVQDTITVDVGVADNVEISCVELYIDSQYVGWANTPPYAFTYDTTQLSNGSHQFSVIAYDVMSNTAEDSVNVKVNNPVAFSAIYVNAGGAEMVFRGVTWQDDRENNSHSRVVSRDLKIDNPVYNSERCGDFTYSFSVPNGVYNVCLKFAELCFTYKGKRVFNVAINGNQVIKNLDLVKAAGFATPYDLTFPVTVEDECITIEFISSINLAKVNAIEITKP